MPRRALTLATAISFTLCLITWYAIAKTIGLRVSPEAEIAGLDISEHGMYGYPEVFIPQPEYSTGLQTGAGPAPVGAPAPAMSPMTSTES